MIFLSLTIPGTYYLPLYNTTALPSFSVSIFMAFLLLLGWRLWHLKEEHWEYRFTSTPQNLSRWGWGSSDTPYSAMNLLRNPAWAERLFQKNSHPIPAYPAASNIFARAHHWLIPFNGAYRNIFSVIWLIVTAIYILYISNEHYLTLEFSKITLPAFFLFPILGFSQVFYTQLQSADVLLKPILRERLILELGLAGLILSSRIFLIMILIIWIFPISITRPVLLLSNILWIDVGIALALGIFCLGLSAIIVRLFDHATSRYVSFWPTIVLALLFTGWVPHLSLFKIAVVAMILCVAGIVLLRLAYFLWCDLDPLEIKRRCALTGAFLILLGLIGSACFNVHSASSEIIDTPDYIVYIPDHLDYQSRHPLIIALSPSSNADAMINTWKENANKFQWIILASKKFHNGIPWPVEKSIFSKIKSDVKSGHLSRLVDQKMILATGLSGGAWASYDYADAFPEFISGLVLNTGMMCEIYIKEFKENRSTFPKNKFAVFLASPTDFRYTEMQQDRDFL
ncbi:MAG: hypothetical protein WCI27_03720, partial [Candidatus Omnitrophota bacterium]